MITLISRVFNRLEVILFYPIRIIPKRNFKNAINVSDIAQLKNIIIVRRSNKNTINETFDIFDSVREDALIENIKDIPDLSMNLLGGSFKSYHINFIQKKDASKVWDPKERFLWFKYIKHVTKKGNSIPVYFFLNDIHNKPFPYYHPTDQLAKYIKEKNIANVKKGGKEEVNGACIIKHSPTKLNYWHVEFHILDFISLEHNEESKITRKKVSSDWVKNAAQIAFNSILCQNALKSASIIEKIPIEHYKCETGIVIN